MSVFTKKGGEVVVVEMMGEGGVVGGGQWNRIANPYKGVRWPVWLCVCVCVCVCVWVCVCVCNRER